MAQPYARAGVVSRTFEAASRNMAFQDWIAIGFHLFMWLRVTAAPDGADASFARRLSGLLLTVTLTTVVLVRGEMIRPGRARALLYRVGLFFPMVGSYFVLKWLLPALHPQFVDGLLMRLDLALLGVTPAVWMASFNEPPIVEWFSFFYYSYFYMLAVILLPMLFFARDRKSLQELMVGTLLVCAIGHIGYTLVPGVGPHATLPFAEPVNGGLWWSLIVATVDGAGAQMDIFPSLHTAYPTWFAIYAFTHRKHPVFRWVWPVIAFFALNMVIATMFLRWHWFIDVLAGFATALVAWQLSLWAARREVDRDADEERQPVWETLR
jgi:hypothetical protein